MKAAAPDRSRFGLLVAVALTVAVVAAACAGTTTPSRPSVASAAPSPGSSIGPSASGPSVVVDPGLLEILPDEVQGIPIEPVPDDAARLAEDPTVARELEAIALALAVGGAGEDFAVVNVVRPRSGLLDDAFFRSWRDTYDEAACAAAGGVSGNAEAELGGRRVHIGTCAGGAHTYHVVHESDVIVSITATGERRLGEAIVEGLGR